MCTSMGLMYLPKVHKLFVLITLHVCCIFPSWQMYDAGDFKFLTTVASPPGQNWMGGDFVAADFVLVWSRVS